MQTRQLEQVLVYKLCLNDMRSPKIEITDIVAVSTDKEKMQNFIVENKVEHYMDGTWGKTFKQGSPLEWYNEPHGYDWQGIIEEWIDIDALDNVKARYLFID